MFQVNNLTCFFESFPSHFTGYQFGLEDIEDTEMLQSSNSSFTLDSSPNSVFSQDLDQQSSKEDYKDIMKHMIDVHTVERSETLFEQFSPSRKLPWSSPCSTPTKLKPISLSEDHSSADPNTSLELEDETPCLSPVDSSLFTSSPLTVDVSDDDISSSLRLAIEASIKAMKNPHGQQIKGILKSQYQEDPFASPPTPPITPLIHSHDKSNSLEDIPALLIISDDSSNSESSLPTTNQDCSQTQKKTVTWSLSVEQEAKEVIKAIPVQKPSVHRGNRIIHPTSDNTEDELMNSPSDSPTPPLSPNFYENCLSSDSILSPITNNNPESSVKESSQNSDLNQSLELEEQEEPKYIYKTSGSNSMMQLKPTTSLSNLSANVRTKSLSRTKSDLSAVNTSRKSNMLDYFSSKAQTISSSPTTQLNSPQKMNQKKRSRTDSLEEQEEERLPTKKPCLSPIS